MNKDELVTELRSRLDDLKDTADKCEAVRSFVDQNLLSEEHAIDEQADLLYQLVQKSAAISDLIDDFLDLAQQGDSTVDTTRQIVAEVQAELTRFHENKILPNVGDSRTVR